MGNRSMTETDLHAYADGQLDQDRRAEVEAWLAANPEAAEQVRDIRMQMQAMHAAYDPVLNEPVPVRLTNAAAPRKWPAGIAAGVAWLTCGIVAGWFAHVAIDERTVPTRDFARNALAAHVLYAVEQRHPVEVPAAQEAHLVAWLSRRLQAPIRAPDLNPQGFSLLGGRLIPGDAGPLAQLMYESGTSERLTLTVSKAVSGQPETGFRLMEKDGASAFYWVDRDYGYALSGSVGRDRLLAVTNAVHRQLAQSAKP